MENRMIIIGAGTAGLSAALTLAKQGIPSILVSDMPSERAQSVMAEGGMNAAMNLEVDSPEQHMEDTIKAGRSIADSKAVEMLCEAAPKIVEQLYLDGIAFNLDENHHLALRAFGGQSVKRTVFASSNTGKQLMHVLISQVREYEAKEIIERYTNWQFLKLLSTSNQAYGCILVNRYTQEKKELYGKVLIMTGGLNGLFGNATGSMNNTGSVTANLFVSGVKIANGEFIQYHPTTVRLHGKNMLITEAVRGEGGRLYYLENNQPVYFMEEKYPELGNLMPRDVIAREEYRLMKEGKQIYLDMSHLSKEVYENRLKGVIEDCLLFLNLDPRKQSIPIEPGIHYFMGGIWVDIHHRTSMKNLYAAGECSCQYHGANRLGGNSLLGALYGGRIAALSAIEDNNPAEIMKPIESLPVKKEEVPGSYMDHWIKMQKIMKRGLGIIRNQDTMLEALNEIEEVIQIVEKEYDPAASEVENQSLRECCLLAKAMLLCAIERKESRGAHYRSDYPNESKDYQKQTIAIMKDSKIDIYFERAGERNED